MRTIEVIANPYISVDKDGIPQGAVSGGAPGVYVGARVDLVASKKSGKIRFYYPTEKGGKGPRKVKVPHTIDFVTSILAGELLVTNEADAAIVGISPKEFLAPEKALEAERAKALAYYQSVKGKDAKVADIPREDTPEPPEGTPAETASAQLTPTVKLTKNTEA